MKKRPFRAPDGCTEGVVIKPAKSEQKATVQSKVKVTTRQNFVGDTRFLVTDAPRVVDARECREWAREATKETKQ